MEKKMFDLEKYIKVNRTYLKRDNNGRITAHMNINIDDEEISKEIEELRKNLLNIRKILGYDFALIVSKNGIKVMKEFE